MRIIGILLLCLLISGELEAQPLGGRRKRQPPAERTKTAECIPAQWQLVDAETQQPLANGFIVLNDSLWASTDSDGRAEICVPQALMGGQVTGRCRGYLTAPCPITPEMASETCWQQLPLHCDPNGPCAVAWAGLPNDLPAVGWKRERGIPIPCFAQDEKNRTGISHALIHLSGGRAYAVTSREGFAEIFIPLKDADGMLVCPSPGHENGTYPVLEVVIDCPYITITLPEGIPAFREDAFACTRFFEQWDARPIHTEPFHAHIRLLRKRPDPRNDWWNVDMAMYGDLYAPAGMAQIDPEEANGWQFRANQAMKTPEFTNAEVITTLRTWLETDMALSAHSPLAPEHRGAYQWKMLPPTVYNGHPAWCIGYSATGVEGKLWVTAAGGIIRQDESRQSCDSLIKHVILNAPWHDFRLPLFAEQEVITSTGATRTRIFLEDMNLRNPEPVRGRLRDLDLSHPMVKYSREFWEMWPEQWFLE